MAIFTAIAGAVAGALFAAGTAAFAIASTVIATGLALGASLLVSYLNRPKARAYSAIQGHVQFGANVPACTVYGTSKVKGQRVFYAKYGSGNKFNAEVFILANGRCDGLEPVVYFYGEAHDLEVKSIIGNEAAHYGVDGFGTSISIRFYDGTPGQGADTKLVTDTVSLGKTWKSTSVCAGLTYVVVERTWSADLFKHGRPEFDFVLRGLCEYDPRFDDTAGGDGDQRLADPSTWEHTENPAIHRLNYQLGLKGLLSDRTLIGVGKPIAAIDVASHIAAANVCDALRSGKPTYACSLFVQAEDDHTEVLKEFEDAMAGYAMSRNGFTGVIAGAPQTPVCTIGPDDIRIAEGQHVAFRKSAFELFNILSGQFTSIESHWKPESLTTVTVNADVTEDGRRRQAGNDFLQVTDADTAQYLLNIRYRQNRKGGSVKLPVSRRVGLQAEVGTWVEYADRTWLVTGRSFDARLRFTLSLKETAAAVYDDGDIEPGPIVIPPPPSTNPSLLTTVQNFGVAAGFITDGNGVDIPTLEMTWTPPADPSIVAVRFEYVIEGGDQLFRDQSEEPESGQHFTTKNVVGGRVYDARATITTVPDRLKTFTAWETTLTATVDPYFPIIEIIAAADKRLDDQIRRVRALAAGETLNDISDFLALDRERTERRVEAAGLSAGIVTESLLRITADEALAAVITTIFAAYGGADASVITGYIASVDVDLNALAEALTLVEAAVGDVSAQGLVSISASADPEGGTVDIAIRARVTEAGATTEVGLYMGIEDGDGYVAIKAPNAYLIDANDVVRNMLLFPVADTNVVPITNEGGTNVIRPDLTGRVLNHKVTLTANSEVRAPIGVVPMSFNLLVERDSNGSRTLGWDSDVFIAPFPTLSAVALSKHAIRCNVIDTNPLRIRPALDGDPFVETPVIAFRDHVMVHGTGFGTFNFSALDFDPGNLLLILAASHRDWDGGPGGVGTTSDADLSGIWNSIASDGELLGSISRYHRLRAIWKIASGDETTVQPFSYQATGNGRNGRAFHAISYEFLGGSISAGAGAVAQAVFGTTSITDQAPSLSGVAAPVLSVAFAAQGAFSVGSPVVPDQSFTVTPDQNESDSVVIGGVTNKYMASRLKTKLEATTPATITAGLSTSGRASQDGSGLLSFNLRLG